MHARVAPQHLAESSRRIRGASRGDETRPVWAATTSRPVASIIFKENIRREPDRDVKQTSRPRGRRPPNSHFSSHRPPVHAPARKVLVVDDNVDGANVLARLLKASGHRVEVVHDGLRALEVARTTAPEVVLLDIGLPELDGYDVARRMRGLKGLEHVMLVAPTGSGQEADRVRASAAGFDHHLVKPVDPETVCTLIAQHQALG